MRRREFITLLGGAAASWPVTARAQPPAPDRVRRVGLLMGPAEGDPEAHTWVAAFVEGLRELGWTEGRNLQLIYRWAGGNLGRIETFGRELIELKPDVILASNTPAVAALKHESQTIPVVFANLSDPVDTGLVPNLARPGGNITGFTAFEYSLAGKWLETLKAIAPRISRIALVFDPETGPFAEKYISSLQAAGQSLGVESIEAPVRHLGDVERVLVGQAREPGGSILVMPTSFAVANRLSIIPLVARYRVPAIYPYPVMAKDGGLVAYGADSVSLFRRAASYVDRIMRGANPGDLPVQQPTKYNLVINLKTAKALGLDVPATLLARADEVIE
jgi:putative ABC transport system substrate-binding protein